MNKINLSTCLRYYITLSSTAETFDSISAQADDMMGFIFASNFTKLFVY